MIQLCYGSYTRVCSCHETNHTCMHIITFLTCVQFSVLHYLFIHVHVAVRTRRSCYFSPCKRLTETPERSELKSMCHSLSWCSLWIYTVLCVIWQQPEIKYSDRTFYFCQKFNFWSDNLSAQRLQEQNLPFLHLRGCISACFLLLYIARGQILSGYDVNGVKWPQFTAVLPSLWIRSLLEGQKVISFNHVKDRKCTCTYRQQDQPRVVVWTCPVTPAIILLA